MEVDLENLKRKVDCGADVVVTQLFYDNNDFFRFRDRCEQVGIRQPIIPGLLPVTNLAQIKRITSMCGATMPTSFLDELAQKDDAQWQTEVGIAFATRQVQDLMDRGVAGLHFYVLNKSEATLRVASQVNPPLRAT